MNNLQLVERVYLFAQQVRRKSAPVASALQQAVPSLLGYEGDLNTATEEDLRGINGLGEKTAPYVARILRGEDFETVLRDTPRNFRPSAVHRPSGRTRDEWNGRGTMQLELTKAINLT